MLRRLLPILVLAFMSGAAPAQNYPAKPIRIITSGAGGGNDIISRVIATGISGPLYAKYDYSTETYHIPFTDFAQRREGANLPCVALLNQEGE